MPTVKLTGESSSSIDIPSMEKFGVVDLRNEVARELGIDDPHLVMMIYRGKVLKDSAVEKKEIKTAGLKEAAKHSTQTLEEVGIKDGCKVYVYKKPEQKVVTLASLKEMEMKLRRRIEKKLVLTDEESNKYIDDDDLIEFLPDLDALSEEYEEYNDSYGVVDEGSPEEKFLVRDHYKKDWIVKDEVQACAPYNLDITTYLLKLKIARVDYLASIQTAVNPLERITSESRFELVNYLTKTAAVLHLTDDSLHLAVINIDRFLSSNVVTKRGLPLLGLSSLFLSSKFQEVKTPSISAFADIISGSYTNEEVLEMERSLFKALGYNAGCPTVLTFTRIFSRAWHGGRSSADQFEYLARYVAELSLGVYACTPLPVSMVAAASIFLARFILHPECHPWDAKLVLVSGYTALDLQECVLALHRRYLDAKEHDPSRVKYASAPVKCVSSLRSLRPIPHDYFDSSKWHDPMFGEQR